MSTNRNSIREASQRPQWLDEQLYPFQSRFVEVEGNRIHYIDEGSGPTLFFVHPGVGWSFMYSDMIQALRGRFRCVALDLPGFGLSAAAPRYRHTLTGDSRLLERFIEALGLKDILLFSHDVTGSIALGVVARRPEWLRVVVVLPRLSKVHRLPSQSRGAFAERVVRCAPSPCPNGALLRLLHKRACASAVGRSR